MVYDVILRNGRIVDGKGNAWYRGEVAVKDGKIKEVGRSITGNCSEEIDAENNIIAPGFIDVHTHSDNVFFVDSTAQSKVRQGVTTEVTGNCGMSAAPYSERLKSKQPRSFGFKPFWHTFEEYIDALARQPKTVNIAPLVGHGTIRSLVVGFEDREPTDEELTKMKKILEKSLLAGAVGLSLGIYFAPGFFAKQEEFVELAKIVKKHGGVVASDNRDSQRLNIGLIAATKEFIDIGRESGASIQFSHIKAVGPSVWGKSQEVLELFEEARNEGIDITCDQYPYTYIGGGLVPDTLPRSFLAGKNTQEIEDELKKPEVISKLKEEVADHIRLKGGAENGIIAEYPYNPDFEGKTVQELSDEYGKEPAEMVMSLISNYHAVSWTFRSLKTEDVDNFIQYPWTMIGSDGSSVSVEGPLSKAFHHPRNFGAFPRVIKEFVKERKVLRLEDAIRKMTSLSAQKFSLHDRGCIEEGKWADIVIFDENNITDATLRKPKQYPTGIPYVMVNGELVIKNGQFTGSLPGRLARMK